MLTLSAPTPLKVLATDEVGGPPDQPPLAVLVPLTPQPRADCGRDVAVESDKAEVWIADVGSSGITAAVAAADAAEP